MSKIEENDFIVAIQALLMKARESGWTVEKIMETANQAIEEFELEEFSKPDGGDEADEYE